MSTPRLCPSCGAYLRAPAVPAHFDLFLAEALPALPLLTVLPEPRILDCDGSGHTSREVDYLEDEREDDGDAEADREIERLDMLGLDPWGQIQD